MVDDVDSGRILDLRYSLSFDRPWNVKDKGGWRSHGLFKTFFPPSYQAVTAGAKLDKQIANYGTIEQTVPRIDYYNSIFCIFCSNLSERESGIPFLNELLISLQRDGLFIFIDAQVDNTLDYFMADLFVKILNWPSRNTFKASINIKTIEAMNWEIIYSKKAWKLGFPLPKLNVGIAKKK